MIKHLKNAALPPVDRGEITVDNNAQVLARGGPNQMIFIGGIGPRRIKLENHPRICSNCGLSQAYLVRLDDYLSLFFIPILRIRKGQPFVECERCGHVTDESGQVYAPGTVYLEPDPANRLNENATALSAVALVFSGLSECLEF